MIQNGGCKMADVCRSFFNDNRLFYRYGGHIEFIRFKEHYGMPRGHSLSICAHFSGKKRTSLYISREKGDHYYSCTSKHGTTIFFSHYNLFLGKRLEKLARKARVYILSECIWTCSCPPGHPIILPKSNTFNIAAVSIKRSIDVIRTSLKDFYGSANFLNLLDTSLFKYILTLRRKIDGIWFC